MPQTSPLFKHQVEGIKWLLEKPNRLLADDMGLGKTRQNLEAAASLGLPAVLVVCPAIAKNVWKTETKKWTPKFKATYLEGRGSFRWPQPGEILAVNYDILPACPSPPPKRKGEKTWPKLPAELIATLPKNLIVIADEVQKIKNAKAKRTEAFRCICFEAREKGGRVWENTGTPLLNKPSEVWNILVAANLQYEAFGDLGKTKNEIYTCAMEMGGGYKDRFGWKYNPSKVSPEFAKRLARVSLRRTKEEVLDLPPKRFDTLQVDVAAVKEADDVLKLLTDQGIDLEEADLKALQSGISFQLISKARAALAKAKTPAAMELADDCEENEELPIFFSAHLHPVETLAKRPGWAKITGDETTEQRTKVEYDFQAGKLKGIACTIRSTGVALTLTKASRVVMIDQDWTPANNSQAVDRAYRIGQTKSILVTTLVANHALDEHIARLLEMKTEFVEKIVEKAREYQSGAAKEAESKPTAPLFQGRLPFGQQVPKPVFLPTISQSAPQKEKPVSLPAGVSPSSKEGVVFLLQHSDKMVERCLVALYDRQTLDEKQRAGTKHINGVGFNKFDAPFGTDLAERVKKGLRLSGNQIAAARKMLAKYSGQLADIAEMKAAKKGQ